MYYYLSFLRPPPTTTSLGSTIILTPQIANDLRTELKDDPTDIYHVWECSTPSSSSSSSSIKGTSIIPAGKLTTYSPPYNTYKPLSLSLPSRARIGDSWRIGLYSRSSTSPTSSEGGEDDVDGRLPLRDGVVGVWSGWIKILPPTGNGSGKGKTKESGKEEKQTRIMRRWKLSSPSSSATGLRSGLIEEEDNEGEEETELGKEAERITIVEQTSFDLNKKIWDSGLAISSWLSEHLPSSSTSSLSSNRTGGELTREMVLRRICGDENTLIRPLRIIELGAGTGLVAIALASILARMRSKHERPQEYEILTTDLGSAIPLIEENLELNQHLWRSSSSITIADGERLERRQRVDVKSRVLDWDESIPSDVNGQDIDIVLAADVTYNTSSFPSLLRTLITLLTPRTPSAPRPLLLLAYKQRDESERELWTMLKEEGVEMGLVDVVRGVEGEDGEGGMEIWVARHGRMT